MTKVYCVVHRHDPRLHARAKRDEQAAKDRGPRRHGAGGGLDWCSRSCGRGSLHCELVPRRLGGRVRRRHVEPGAQAVGALLGGSVLPAVGRRCANSHGRRLHLDPPGAVLPLNGQRHPAAREPGGRHGAPRRHAPAVPSAVTVTAPSLIQAPSPILYSTKSTPEPLPSSPVNESGTGWVTQVAGTPSMADTGPVVSSSMVALTGSEMLPSESWN